MNKAISVISIIAMLFIAVYGWSSLNRTFKAIEEGETLKLRQSINYAVDAAIEKMMESYDLGLDYVDLAKMDLDPNTALEEFTNVMILNYGLTPTREMVDEFQTSYMPVFVVAVYDGYYIATIQNKKSVTEVPENTPTNVDYGLQFSPKKPYTYTNADGICSLNFGANHYTIVTPNNTMERREGFPAGLTSRKEVLSAITAVVSTDMQHAIDKVNDFYNYENVFFLPSGITKNRGSQYLAGPSVLALVQNLKINTSRPINGFAIGGGKIDTVRYVVGYIEGGVKYYCFADQLEEGVLTPEGIFSTTHEAAMNGYFPDIKRLGRKRGDI